MLNVGQIPQAALENNRIYARRKFLDQAIHLCERIWEAVQGALCADSPEGHSMNTSADDEVQMNDKDAMSFSWRSLKESRHGTVSRQQRIEG